jgi:hypothetical protein
LWFCFDDFLERKGSGRRKERRRNELKGTKIVFPWQERGRASDTQGAAPPLASTSCLLRRSGVLPFGRVTPQRELVPCLPCCTLCLVTHAFFPPSRVRQLSGCFGSPRGTQARRTGAGCELVVQAQVPKWSEHRASLPPGSMHFRSRPCLCTGHHSCSVAGAARHWCATHRLCTERLVWPRRHADVASDHDVATTRGRKRWPALRIGQSLRWRLLLLHPQRGNALPQAHQLAPHPRGPLHMLVQPHALSVREGAPTRDRCVGVNDEPRWRSSRSAMGASNSDASK